MKSFHLKLKKHKSEQLKKIKNNIYINNNIIYGAFKK